MKKIVLAAALIGTAAMVNAAAVDWSASKVCDPVQSEAQGKLVAANGWLGYVVLAADLSAVTADLNNNITDTLAAKAVGPVKTTTNKGAFTDSTASGNVAAGNQDFYLIVLNAGTLASATSYFVSSKVTTTIDASLDTSIVFGGQDANSKVAANWTSMAAPEPTSGLMLLLGMGVLALRRRRA